MNERSSETTVTRNDMENAAKLADEIEENGLLEIAEEDEQYRTNEMLIVLALRHLAGTP